MKNFVIAALPLHAALAANTHTNAAARRNVAGQEIGSGLGELQHYRLWADPSGKNTVAKQGVAQSRDCGTARAPCAAVAKPTTPMSTDVATLK